MTQMHSTAVFDKRVYAQDSQPSDTRDGVLWVDTSDPARTVYVYSSSSSSWERVSPLNGTRVTDEASSFTESAVTVADTTNAGVQNGALVAAPDTVVADYEDGSKTPTGSSWSIESDTSSFSAVNVTDMEGSYLGRIDNSNAKHSIIYTSSSPEKHGLRYQLKVNDGTGNDSDNTYLEVRDSSDNKITDLRIYLSSLDFQANSSTNQTLTTLSLGTVYTIEIIPDFANSQFSVTIDGTSYGPYDMNNSSASDLDDVRITQNTQYSGSQAQVDFDLLETFSVGSETGDARIEWTAPDDIDVWDLASFLVDTSNGSITIDVEDSSGTTHYTDIGKDHDISNIAASNNVAIRANISKNAGKTHPKLEYAARRYET